MFFWQHQQNKIAKKRTGFWLYSSYIVSLFLISVLIVGYAFLLNNFLKFQENDSRVINLSARQRTLSQIILNLSFQLSRGETQNNDLLKKHLSSNLGFFSDSQNFLSSRNQEIGASGRNSRQIQALLDTAEPSFSAIVTNVKEVLKSSPASEKSKEAVFELIKAESEYLVRMDEVVARYELESKEKVFYLETLILVITVMILAVIAFEAIFIFWPLTQRINRTLYEMEKFRLAVENSSDGVVIANKNKSVIYANETQAKMAGFSLPELLGEKLESRRLWGGLSGEDFFQNLWQAVLEDKKSFLTELRHQRKNGQEYDLALSVFPVLNKRNEPEFLVGISRDITKEKEIDRAKSEFVSLASHQLKSPLSKIKWLMELVLAGDFGKLNQDQKHYLEEIDRSNQILIDLVNSLLDVSRIDLGVFNFEIGKINPKEIMGSVIEESESLILEKNLTISENYSGAVPEILGDAKLTRIIFQNLITNAVKYSFEKTEVLVLMKTLSQGEKIGEERLNQDFLFVSVKNLGFGIPDAQKERIFSKLFRADNVRTTTAEGTGLGLYLSKQVLDKMGGKIWFESEENKETTFFVLMPLELKKD